MKYIIPSTFFLYNILTGGEDFENLLEQQIFMAEKGVDWNAIDNFVDIEREIVLGILVKREKERHENKIAEWELFQTLLANR